MPFNQYQVRLDGSRYLTLRNRKFLRPFVPVNPDGHQGQGRHNLDIYDDSVDPKVDSLPNPIPTQPNSTEPPPDHNPIINNTPVPTTSHPELEHQPNLPELTQPIPSNDVTHPPPCSPIRPSHKALKRLQDHNAKGMKESEVPMLPDSTRSGKKLRH